MQLIVTRPPSRTLRYLSGDRFDRSSYEEVNFCGCPPFTVECELSNTVYQLKSQIETMISVPVGQQCLIIPPEDWWGNDGRCLLDPDPLAHYHLTTGQNLIMKIVDAAPVPEQSMSEPDYYSDLLLKLTADQSGISKIQGCIQVPLSFVLSSLSSSASPKTLRADDRASANAPR